MIVNVSVCLADIDSIFVGNWSTSEVDTAARQLQSAEGYASLKNIYSIDLTLKDTHNTNIPISISTLVFVCVCDVPMCVITICSLQFIACQMILVPINPFLYFLSAMRG